MSQIIVQFISIITILSIESLNSPLKDQSQLFCFLY